ncbi:hypothetical protein CAPTEDRAFT_146207 [Capitella teleta]|uniref:Membrane-associated guanylate kinase, WW and PDZ domain-containing protein 2 n=1 Tax=Capitella teleta TaxID=283909 RepID=R7VLM2_CAPTE|nr:hypothetical protein CAPTEDRAFT_146207 [Capitella teleta]|eukprot:ELU17710.1 hypothetical protein CAPTEDRAFT_146207 [Capitella teleta]
MHKESTLTRKKSLERAQSAGNLGPLPSNWEMAYTEDGIPYFIDHETETTHWLDPRLSTNMKMSPLECDENELPYGWEKVEDPHFGTYFIDHVNRKTQYENPVVQARRLAQDDDVDGRKSPPAYGTLRPAFTKNPGDLKGQFLETELVKSQRGFGFTIIGADNSDEEFLQIKSIVPNGPAYADGKLRRGDVLIYINRQCVLGYTHQDVVSLFQSIQVGDKLHVRVCRGYLLPFDPDDPNTEIITTVAVSLPPVTMPTTKVTQKSDNSSDGGGGEMLSMQIVKGAMGFGFTIADSMHGQRVKQILDSQRCQRLQEGDLLVTINETNVRDLSHLEVVDVLKGCSRGQAASITVQRGDSFSGSSDSISLNRHDHSDQRSLTPDTSRDHSFPSNRLRHSNPMSATHSPRKPDQADTVRAPESRSRTPGPEFMRGRDRDEEPYFKRHNAPEMRSKTPTPQPGLHNLSGTPDFIPASHYQSPPQRSSSRNIPSPKRPTSPVHGRQQTTSFEQQEPAHIARNHTAAWENSPSASLDLSHSPSSAPLGDDKFMEMTVILKRMDNGFGFRIIGGTEEGSQVSVGDIVPGGAAEQDGRLRPGDEILYVEGQCVVGSSHHRVVQVMGHCASSGTVALVVRRRTAGSATPATSELSVRVPNRMTDSFPYDVAVTRREDEGFGFVIISSRTRSGSVIGKIIEGSPAERCGNLRVGDRILAVNNINILRLHHEEIVNIIKDSGHSVTLTIGPPQGEIKTYSKINKYFPLRRFLAKSLAWFHGECHGKFYAVELLRGSRGFGFSIRGGREFSNMPLYVLRIADGGAANMDQRLRVGDQLIEINGYNTNNMTHAEAIELIQSGGSSVRLLIKRSSKSGE